MKQIITYLAVAFTAVGISSCTTFKPVSARSAGDPYEKDLAMVDAAGGAAANTSAPAVNKLRTLAIMKVKVKGATKTVTFELFPEDAPMTVENFVRNVKDGVYRGLAFHRAIPNYLVQTGDPITEFDSTKQDWGTGDPGFNVPAEIKRKHTRGSVAMARLGDINSSGQDSNGSQFYFALDNLKALDGNYTVFGNVISGIEVIDEISRLPVDTNDVPVSRVELKSIKITESSTPSVTASQEALGDERSKRKGSKPDYEKGNVEKFIERVW